MSSENLRPLLDEIHKLGYTLDTLVRDGATNNAPRVCQLLAKLVEAMLSRVDEFDSYANDRKEEMQYLEYLSAMNYAMFFELGFTDAEINEFSKANADPCQMAIQRIRDLKAAKTNTVH